MWLLCLALLVATGDTRSSGLSNIFEPDQGRGAQFHIPCIYVEGCMPHRAVQLWQRSPIDMEFGSPGLASGRIS